MTEPLQQKIATLPKKPGIYQFKDQHDEFLYIGKAKNIRNRVRSHFAGPDQLEGRRKLLYRKTADVTVIVTNTETEALILENTLIKQHQPVYNIELKDDKSYPYICIKKEPFPRVFSTRRVIKDGSRYFGPYTNVRSMNQALRVVRRIFQLRSCSLDLRPEPIAAGKYEVCLEYHIKNCTGPCEGHQTEENYGETLSHVTAFLQGKNAGLTTRLEASMKKAARDLNFERAAILRNQISAINAYTEKQTVVVQKLIDRDLFALATCREENVAAAVVFKVRDGKLIGKQHKILKGIDGHSDEELLQTYVERYYTEATFFPDEVFLSLNIPSQDALGEYLRERRGRKVVVKKPQRGDKANLIRMVEANAQVTVDDWVSMLSKRGEARIPFAVKALQADLGLSHLPQRIECFDISHLGGTGTVASCIVFVNGKPSKREYRGYKIRSVPDGKPDDFMAMHEVVTRRYKRLIREGAPIPDLVVIDGGKGQLSSAVRALQEVKAYGKFPIIGLAKRLEEIYFPRDSFPIYIAKQSVSLQLIQRVRDEAHRFAVELQRKQRRKKLLHSELLDIPGIGPKRAQALVKKFGSVRMVKLADPIELAQVVGSRAAEAIHKHTLQHAR